MSRPYAWVQMSFTMPCIVAYDKKRKVNMAVAANDLAKISKELESSSPQEILKKSFELTKGVKVISISLQLEDNILLDMMLKADLNFRAYTLDTGRLHESTYLMMDRIRFKYGIELEVYHPNHEAVEKLMREKGLYSFKESFVNRKECCYIRKVEPYSRAMKGASLWVTGLRRTQSEDRANTPIIEDAGGLIKVSPIVNWSWERVMQYAKENKVPKHPLYDQGFISIGCDPCTRAVEPGEDIRAGRWWWENADHKECGLHIKPS